ncbi:hypothetical protein SAMN05216382_1634 [Sphingomonas palmae]|uniref:Uncharacterized protein n=1 Tax=Sphingomonas palmae TaxID=1855283 RepID=A0A1H7NMK9_9SPHN|nr:hypothetical protein SAMN05216382_1634 [Sphingomonas palmae]
MCPRVTVNFLNFRPAHRRCSVSRARTHMRVSVNFLNFGALPLGSTPDCAYEALTPNQPDQERA